MKNNYSKEDITLYTSANDSFNKNEIQILMKLIVESGTKSMIDYKVILRKLSSQDRKIEEFILRKNEGINNE